MDVNHVRLSGEVIGAPRFSHSVYGEDFYQLSLAVPRLSGAIDTLPLMLPGSLAEEISAGSHIEAEGQLRSYRRLHQPGARLQLMAFVRHIGPETQPGVNEVELLGCLLRSPAVRRTPLGREIADLLLRLDRPNGKRDCVPCIAWGRHAHACDALPAGTRMHLLGRMQSRLYQKQLEDGVIEERVTYEVSIGSADLQDSSSASDE